MLFPPPGVKIRRTIETLFLPGTATLIAGRDPRRVLTIVRTDELVTTFIALAGNPEGLRTGVSIAGINGSAAEFWGPEEVWAQCTYPTSPAGGNILVQSVFYD